MFGISFSEIVLIAMIALVVVGPQKLPAMLLSVGRGIARIRRLTNDVRAQTGIDEILREEGIDGVRELRSLLRGEVAAARARDANDDAVELDPSQEYPPEGVDASGALPDDLVDPNRTASERSGSDGTQGDALPSEAAPSDHPPGDAPPGDAPPENVPPNAMEANAAPVPEAAGAEVSAPEASPSPEHVETTERSVHDQSGGSRP